MNRTFLLTLLALLLFQTHGRAEEIVIPPELRDGIKTDAATVRLALQIRADGWYYILPVPKSPQAAWGNPDGRTTWWVGYWINKKTQATSASTPALKDGTYTGDGKGQLVWRRGGSPPPPNALEWLLSVSGGPPPRSP